MFRVTSEILRVAEGQVRCGRCHHQFDALERLIGEEPTPPPVHEPRIEVEEPPEHEEITLEGKHIEITGTYRVVDPNGQDAEPRLRQEVVEEWVEIDDEDIAASTATQADLREEDPASPQATPSPKYTTASITELPAPANSDTSSAEPLNDFDLPPPRRSAKTAWLWRLLPAPLTLLLMAQIIHHYRAELARHPRYGEHITAAYQALGVELTPDWNLHAYEIQHWAVVPDAATGTLNLRASITNSERFAQPYPLLKLVLQDRWGEVVREREFEPSEYLDPATSSERLLAPAQRANLAIAIVDPGSDAAGFHFEACLRGRNGVVCAGEVPR